MILVDISNDPQYGFKRKVEAAAILIGMMDYIGKTVTLTTNVRYFEDTPDEAEITIIPQKIVNLVADNSKCVDSKGNIVPCDSPDAVMTEYDYYIAMMAVPVVINDLVVNRIQWADSQGLFN